MRVYVTRSHDKTLARIVLGIVCLFSFAAQLNAKKVYDQPNTNLATFFTQKNMTYVIQHPHSTLDTLALPDNITLEFKGGSIKAPIIFRHTHLKGNVKLQGSHITGVIANNTFNAKWLCHADGVNDDAAHINDMMQVCENIYFPKGIYQLISTHTPKYPINKPYHLGINRSHQTLTGGKGAVLRTNIMAGMLTVYSKPYDIAHSISDITIQGLTFQVVNEATTFDPYQQHCHTISLKGVNGCVIQKCRFQNFWGDAICLNHYNDNEQTGERARNMNVLIQHNYIDGYKHSNRNGVSVINGEHAVIRNNVLVNCSHKTMPGAIDVEANNTAYTVNDILISGNTIDQSQGMNAAISVVSNKLRAPAHNITITKNVITRSNRAFAFWIDSNGCADNITITKNKADQHTTPFMFWQEGETENWTFTGNKFLCPTKLDFGGKLKIKNLIIRDNKIEKLAWYRTGNMPIVLICAFFILACALHSLFSRKNS